MRRRVKIIIAVSIVLLFIFSVTVIIPRAGNIHQLHVNNYYLKVRHEVIENNTSSYYNTMYYFPDNISINGFGKFEIAAVPFYAPHPNVTLNESDTGIYFGVPGPMLDLVLLSANYTSLGSLWFRADGINISSSNYTMNLIKAPFYVSPENKTQGSLPYLTFIGPGYFVSGTYTNFITSNRSLPDGTYYLTLKFSLYRNMLGIPIPEGQYHIQFPFVTIIGKNPS